MKVIPAVDILGGKCVQLIGGKPGTERVQIDDVLGTAIRWQNEGAEMIHIIDLDSALGSGDNLRLVEKLAGSLSVPLQVGGGIRTEQQVRRYFDMGCERVIVGTRAIDDRAFVETISKEYPDGIVVAVDSVANRVLKDGWRADSGRDMFGVVRELSDLPIFGFLHTNVEVEGRLQGIDIAPVKALMEATKKPLIAAGGISTVDDLVALKGIGVHSAVVGMAIYIGTIDFGNAVRRFT